MDVRDVCTAFRHTGWSPMRGRIWDGLLDACVPTKRLNRFEACGREAWVIRNADDPKQFKVAANTCHDRFCIPCQRDRSHVLARNVLALVEGKRCRMITLTLRADETPLAERVNRLHLCFARLRKTVLWQSKVTGGAAFLEVTYNPDRCSWHAHLHLLCVGSYFPKTELSNTWLRITGDSHITDIRLANSPQHAATYVTKYVSKPFDAELTRNAPRLCEAIQALANVKMCMTFGTFRGALLTNTPPEGTWEYVGQLWDIFARSKAGDVDANNIVCCLNTIGSLAAMQFAQDLPPPRPIEPLKQVTRQTLMFETGPDPWG